MPSLQRTGLDQGDNSQQRGSSYQQPFANFIATEAPNFDFSAGSSRPTLSTGLSLSDDFHHQFLMSQHLMQGRLLQQRRQQLMSAAENPYLYSAIHRSNNSQRQYQVDQHLYSSMNPYHRDVEVNPSNRGVAMKRPSEVIVIDDSDNDDAYLPEASPFNPPNGKDKIVNVGPIHESSEIDVLTFPPTKHIMPKSAEVEFSIVIPTDISEVVSLASSMVADEIRSGVYSVSDQNESVLEATAASLELFAKDVILPSLLAANNACTDFDEDSDHEEKETISTTLDRTSNRVFIASLMNLREVMAMNAKSIFALEDHGHLSETWTIQALGIATSVVVAVVQKLNVDSISKLLFDAIKGYDTSKDEFVNCLERTDARTLGTTPKRLLNRAENNAFRVSFNTARAVHPLVARENDDIVELPVATTAFISMVEVGIEGERDYTQEKKKKKLN